MAEKRAASSVAACGLPQGCANHILIARWYRCALVIAGDINTFNSNSESFRVAFRAAAAEWLSGVGLNGDYTVEPSQIIEILTRAPGSVIVEFTLSTRGTSSPTVSPRQGGLIIPQPVGQDDDDESLAPGLIALIVVCSVLCCAMIIVLILYCEKLCCFAEDREKEPVREAPEDYPVDGFNNKDISPMQERTPASWQARSQSDVQSPSRPFINPLGQEPSMQQTARSLGRPSLAEPYSWQPTVGERCEAQYLDGQWYPANISEANAEDGSFSVDWDDGSYSYGIPRSQLRQLGQGQQDRQRSQSAVSPVYEYSEPGDALRRSSPSGGGEMEVDQEETSYGEAEAIQPPPPASPSRSAGPEGGAKVPVQGEKVVAAWRQDGPVQWHSATVHSVDQASGTCMVLWEDGTYTEDVPFTDVRA